MKQVHCKERKNIIPKENGLGTQKKKEKNPKNREGEEKAQGNTTKLWQ
jgi:hypothetical protein